MDSFLASSGRLAVGLSSFAVGLVLEKDERWRLELVAVGAMLVFALVWMAMTTAGSILPGIEVEAPVSDDCSIARDSNNLHHQMNLFGVAAPVTGAWKELFAWAEQEDQTSRPPKMSRANSCSTACTNPDVSMMSEEDSEDEASFTTSTSFQTLPWKETQVDTDIGAWQMFRPSQFMEQQRKQKWDDERQKYRELQQQLSTLRITRSERVGTVRFQDEEGERNSPTAPTAFPWQAPPSSVGWSFVFSNITQFLQDLGSMFQERRKHRWGIEMSCRRELQQQLANLRSIRAQRLANGEIKPEPERCQPTKKGMPCFPWQQPPPTPLDMRMRIQGVIYCLLEAFASFSYEQRRKRRLDADRARHRELLQQLANLRVQRSAVIDHDEPESHIQLDTAFPWATDKTPLYSFGTGILTSFLQSLRNVLDLKATLEARRKSKWDAEKAKFWIIQQQLADLRAVRLQRNLVEKPCAMGAPTAPTTGSTKFSWASNDSSSSYFSPIFEFRISSFVQGYLAARRKAKLDIDLRRMRELHQQLGTLRAIRLERHATPEETLPVELIGRYTPIFPWRTY